MPVVEWGESPPKGRHRLRLRVRIVGRETRPFGVGPDGKHVHPVRRLLDLPQNGAVGVHRCRFEQCLGRDIPRGHADEPAFPVVEGELIDGLGVGRRSDRVDGIRDREKKRTGSRNGVNPLCLDDGIRRVLRPVRPVLFRRCPPPRLHEQTNALNPVLGLVPSTYDGFGEVTAVHGDTRHFGAVPVRVAWRLDPRKDR